MDESLCGAAADALNIRAVFLRSGDIRCQRGFVPFIENDLSLVPQYRVVPTEFRIVTATNQESGESTKNAMFFFTAGVRLVDSALLEPGEAQKKLPNDAVYVEIETEFCAYYEMNGAADETELRSALEEFGRYNVGYHVWPYWREYVQNVCARIGIPPIPVPMFRLSQMAPKAELRKK